MNDDGLGADTEEEEEEEEAEDGEPEGATVGEERILVTRPWIESAT